MDTINFLFGHNDQLTMLQMCLRAFTMFILMLILIRFAGMRTFAKRSPFDTIVTIMLGAILVRGVVGAHRVILIQLLHQVLWWLCIGLLPGFL